MRHNRHIYRLCNPKEMSISVCDSSRSSKPEFELIAAGRCMSTTDAGTAAIIGASKGDYHICL